MSDGKILNYEYRGPVFDQYLNCEIKLTKDGLNKILSRNWISVKDRLPQDNERYLVIDNCGIISINHFLPFMKDFGLDNVTHWMQLPPPPKKETNNE